MEALREGAERAIAELGPRGLLLTQEGPEGVSRYTRCDVLSIPWIRHVMLAPRLIAVIHQILGGRPTYFGESWLRVGACGVRGWHRDSVDQWKRTGSDWDDGYRMVRCGIYMQDHTHHSGGLALRPRSNRPRWPNRPRLPMRTIPIFLNSKLGDLVVWDLRTVHSAEVCRLRYATAMPINPYLQSRLPRKFRLPDERKRMVMFMTFGLPGCHLDRHVATHKAVDYNQELWAMSRFGEDVWKRAKAIGLDILAVTSEYGTLVE